MRKEYNVSQSYWKYIDIKIVIKIYVYTSMTSDALECIETNKQELKSH